MGLPFFECAQQGAYDGTYVFFSHCCGLVFLGEDA